MKTTERNFSFVVVAKFVSHIGMLIFKDLILTESPLIYLFFILIYFFIVFFNLVWLFDDLS